MYIIIYIKFLTSNWKFIIIIALTYMINKKYLTSKNKYLFSALALVLITPVLAKTDIFPDIPLHLQNSSAVTITYSAKPNSILFIDSSTSMIEKLQGGAYKCRIRKSKRKNTKGKNII